MLSAQGMSVQDKRVAYPTTLRGHTSHVTMPA